MTNQSFPNERDVLSEEELELLTSYVGGCLTTDKEEAFDDRMADDDAFFERMAPMVKMWNSPPPSVIEAGARAKVRFAEKQASASQRRAVALQWRRYVAIAATSLSVAASVIFGAFLQLPRYPELARVAGR